MKKIILSSILAVVITISACKKPVATTDCAGTTSTYTTNVKPILDANCVTCHNGSNKSGGYDLSTYSHAKNAKDAKGIRLHGKIYSRYGSIFLRNNNWWLAA